MLAMADQTGLVKATAPGIANAAFVPISSVRSALSILESPDPDSKSQENDGRRISRVDGGYLILNYDKYRAFNYSMKDAAVQKREYRAKHKDIKSDNVRTTSGHSVSASISDSVSEKKERKDIGILADHILEVLKIPMSDKGKTEALLKSFGLNTMIYCVDRMKLYFDEVKKNKWTNYVIGKHWRNLYEKLEYFSSDENLYNKLQDTERANSKKDKIDCRTVSTDFSSDEEIMRKQREKKND
jgi:hypothetical protein